MRIGCHNYNWIPYTHSAGEEFDLERVLAEIVEAGFDAVEFSRVPAELDDPSATRKLLEKAGLTLVGLSVTYKGTPGKDGSLEDMKENARKLVEMGGSMAVLFSQAWIKGGPEEKIPYGNVAELADGFAEFAATLGLDTTFHNHLGTDVQSPEEIDDLMAKTRVCGLCLDTGHLIPFGVDPADYVKKYPSALRHVHLKDTKLKEDGTIDDFVELGAGNSEYRVEDVLNELRAIDYRGWIVSEQDRTTTTPLESARANREFLRQHGL